MVKKSTKFENVGGRITKLGAIIGAVATIIAAATGICTWVSNQFQNAVSEQISDFQQETRAYDMRHEQAVTRLELGMLIEHDPTNKVAIEKMARYYFVDLKGDLYMTEKYSAWAEEYDGDISFVIGDRR